MWLSERYESKLLPIPFETTIFRNDFEIGAKESPLHSQIYKLLVSFELFISFSVIP